MDLGKSCGPKGPLSIEEVKEVGELGTVLAKRAHIALTSLPQPSAGPIALRDDVEKEEEECDVAQPTSADAGTGGTFKSIGKQEQSHPSSRRPMQKTRSKEPLLAELDFSSHREKLLWQ